MSDIKPVGYVEQLWEVSLNELQEVSKLMDAYFLDEMEDYQSWETKSRQMKRFKKLLDYGIKPWFTDPTWERACEIIETRLNDGRPVDAGR
jgi:hypothetical protein